MKKYIILAAAITISLQSVKKHPAVAVNHQLTRPNINYYLHDAVRLILKKITNLEVIA